MLAMEIKDSISNLTIQHVTRNQNKEADRIANEAIDDFLFLREI